MKKFGLFILFILAIAICVGGVFLIRYYNFMPQDETANTTQKSNETIENEVTNNLENSVNNTNTMDTSVTSENDRFSIQKVSNSDYSKYYKLEEEMSIIEESYFKVEKKDNNITITLVKSEQNDALITDDVLKYDTEYKVENVVAEDIDKIFVGGEGQDLVYPNIYLLAKDGSVKGIDVKEGYEKGTFTAYDVSGLKNVESIDQLSVSKPNDSGYEAIVASTKDNKYYELRYEE